MSALLARSRAISPAAVWFPALALIVAGPLLAFSGYLMLLDYPSAPRFPGVSWLPTPSEGGPINLIPLFSVHEVLRVISPFLRDKVFLLCPVILGGYGMYRFLVRSLAMRPTAAFVAGTLYVANPFVLDRYLAGHLHFLLAYALLPWAIVPLLQTFRRPSLRNALTAGIWLFVLAVVDLHIAGMYGLLVIVLNAASTVRPLIRLGYALAALGGALALSAFWFLPALVSPPGELVGLADLPVYASRPSGYGVLPSLLQLEGFWRDEFRGAFERLPPLRLVFIPILIAAMIGASDLVRSSANRRFGLALAVVAIVALILAAGISLPPTAGAFRWLYSHAPYFRIYREPQKFAALIALTYAIFVGFGLNAIMGWRPGRLATILAPVVGIAVILAISYPMLWGLWGQVRLSRYPPGWALAESAMNSRGSGRLMVLPWNQYAVWTFSGGRIVANPTPFYFSREVLIDREAGFSALPRQSPDPFLDYANEVLRHRDSVSRLGHLLAPLGVRYVALLREVDYWQYDFLERQTDLQPILKHSDVTLFENSAWRGNVRNLESEGSGSNLTELITSPKATTVVERLYRIPPRQSPPTNLPGFSRLLPVWETLATEPSNPFVLPGVRCAEGWLLGTVSEACHLGAVAAFPSSGGPQLLWRPAAGANVLGYLVSILTLALASLYVVRQPSIP